MDISVLSSLPQWIWEGIDTGRYYASGLAIKDRQTGRFIAQAEILDADSARNVCQKIGITNAAPFQHLFTSAALAAILIEVRHINIQLASIKKAVSEVKDLLESRALAELQAALSDLNRISKLPREQRISAAGEARFALSVLSNQFYSRLSRIKKPDLALQILRSQLAASIGHAHMYRLLDQEEMFMEALNEATERWRQGAAKVAELLLGENPARFVYSTYSQDVPLKEFVLFVKIVQGDKHLGELEALELYRPRPDAQIPYLSKVLNKQFSADKKTVLPALRHLVALDQSLQAHVQNLEEIKQRTSLAELEERLASTSSSTGVVFAIFDQPDPINAI